MVLQDCQCHVCPYHNDTLYLGCILAQIILPVQTRVLPDCRVTTLSDYVEKVKHIIQQNVHSIPRLALLRLFIWSFVNVLLTDLSEKNSHREFIQTYLSDMVIKRAAHHIFFLVHHLS